MNERKPGNTIRLHVILQLIKEDQAKKKLESTEKSSKQKERSAVSKPNNS